MWCAGGVLLWMSAAAAHAQEAAATLRMSWGEANHPSGIYHAAEAGTVAVVVENGTGEPAALKGAVAFGMREGAEGFKTISVTPVKETTIGAGERVKIPLGVTFAGTGTYALRWMAEGAAGKTIEHADGVTLECIFAPRGAGGTNDPRWLGVLPREAAVVPGYLTDLAVQTGVRRYLLEERFAFDAATGVSLGVGASLGVSAEQVDALFAEAAQAKVGMVLRVSVPPRLGARGVEAFHQYVADAVRRSKGTMEALAITSDGADAVELRAAYVAGYAAAKEGAGERKVIMLGAGDAKETRDVLLAREAGLGAYVDAVAVTDVSADMAVGAGLGKRAVWVLPPLGMVRGQVAWWQAVPAAAGLAEGAAVVAVPPARVDRGVVEHLLGGAVFYQKLHGAAEAPYVAVFQGDGYAVAAVAGFGANTPLDEAWPELARRTTVVLPAVEDHKPAYPNLEVGDDSGSMRVVDWMGASVECRDWDTLYVPAEERVVYVLEGGKAEDLMASLRSGRPNRFPVMEVTAYPEAAGAGVVVKLTNVGVTETGGMLRVVAPNKNGIGGIVLGEKKFVPVSSGKTLETMVGITGDLPADKIVIVELVTDGEKGVIQRTAVPMR
jgi:hypothetical protein